MLKPIITGIVGAATALVATQAMAEYPDHPVTVIVPFSAGGGTDSDARGFQPFFGKALGTTIVMKNVDGAAGTVGAAETARSKPDGYTLGFLPIGPAVIQPNLRNLPYSVDSFVPVCQINANPVVLMTSKDSPINTVEDFKKTVGAAPDKYAYGSSGAGTIPHLAMAATAVAMDLKMKHIPHKGTADAMKSLAGGFIQFFADTPVVVERFDTKPLAAYTDKRIDGLDAVPTMKEKGYDLQFSVWRGLFAPKGTPEESLAKLEVACKRAAESQGFKDFSAKAHNDIAYMGRKAFTEFVAAEFKKNAKILEAAGLKKK